MEELNFKFKSKKAIYKNFGVTTGVANSGNLEILLNKADLVSDNEVSFTITTTVPGHSQVWHAVLEEFAHQHTLGGCHLFLNDCGAIPAIVALRLNQLYETFGNENVDKELSHQNYLELNARERILAIADEGSFNEWLKPEQELVSPHLAPLGLATSFDDGVIIGSAKFNNTNIYIASQNFAFMGGGVGEISGAKLSGLCLKALQEKPDAVILLLDSGGVRLQEANAGEIAISELIATVMQLRFAGIPIFGVVAGRNGAFGGIGITSECLDNIILTENARTGVSGPEVIQTVMGSSEYNASDRALVWRTCGGRHRVIMGDGKYSEKSIAAIKDALKKLITLYKPLGLKTLLEENKLLAERLLKIKDCHDGTDVWEKYGYSSVQEIPNLSDHEFLNLLIMD